MFQVRAGDVVPTPWRNRRGRTRELLAQPAGPDWTIRVSMADIDTDGPFLAFPGIERWFAVVEGAGVMLDLAGDEQRVALGDPPFRFDGAAAPGCTLLSGPVRDFNLMVRGAVGVMRVVQGGVIWYEPLQQRGLFTRCAGRWEGGDGGSCPLAAETLLFDLPDAPGRFVPDGQGPCGWWLGTSVVAA